MIYGLLLAAETAAASVIFWTSFPMFSRIMQHSGEPQVLGAGTFVPVLAAAALLQACYWARYRRVAVRTPVHSVALGHLLVFASRVSFFFGSALFSLVFFRHVPQLAVLPPTGQGVVKAAGILAVLFSLFCYSLEIERLGKAMEEEPAGSAVARKSVAPARASRLHR
ncbi:MAG: hypothetical protein U1E40_16110 [Amaricoccus sp.]